jgi:hypothetical protein
MAISEREYGLVKILPTVKVVLRNKSGQIIAWLVNGKLKRATNLNEIDTMRLRLWLSRKNRKLRCLQSKI